MTHHGQLRVLLTAPDVYHQATGEAFVAWRWAEALSDEVELTVFCFGDDNKEPLKHALPKARVVTAPKPRLFSRFKRFEAMAKPHYPAFMKSAHRFMREHRGQFDIAHQIMPQGARYPIPLRGHGVPYVVGPLGGSLETPKAFRSEAKSAAWFTKARALDHWRFRNDPWLRRSYADAALVLGVAPYVNDILSDIQLRRFETVLELGVQDIPPAPQRDGEKSEIKLLHVGRGVRTKGLRDVVRALSILKDEFPDLTLLSAGTGEEIDICISEAEQLGIRDRIEFLGLIPRNEVETLYQKADIFAFPSFREPAGNVLYEAMRWGLPVIAAARGGPDWIVDDQTGFRIPVTEPGQYAKDIASAIRELVTNPAKRLAMGEAARAKLAREALWPAKAKHLVSLYKDVLQHT